MQPLTAREIDEIQCGKKWGPAIQCRLIATARLAPQWKPPEEPPDSKRYVLGVWKDLPASIWQYDQTKPEWRWSEVDSELHPPAPDWWCELPTNPDAARDGDAD